MRETDLLVTAPIHDEALARLRPLSEAARGYVQASRAERTRDAYQKQWSAFQTWCSEHALAPLPAGAETVALFVTARAQAGRKVATLAQALAAIGQAHRLSGHASPCASVLVRETMQGIRRTHGSAPAQKAPILDGQLRAMLQTLSRSSRLLGDARDRALLLVGFAGALRRSELIALTVSDLTFSSEGVTVWVRRSKTDQEGHGRKVGLPYGSRPATCPVHSLQAWLKLASITEGSIFRSVDRHGNLGRPLSGRDVARVVQRTASAAGFDARQYAGHSLRAGLATSAAKAGKSTHAIMKTTGHRSVAMVHKYIRDAELFHDNAASGLL